MNELHDLTTDVLVVGAGPSGLVATALLARDGVDHLCITKYNTTAHTPRAHITNQRAMEVFRDLGVEDRVINAGYPAHLMTNNVWATSFAGLEIARRKAWGGRDDLRVEYDTASPTSMCNIGQHDLEPILRDAAEAFGAKLRFGTELVELTQHDSGVTAVIRDRDTAETATVQARYVIGADGGRSLVAQQAGIAMEGETGLGYAVNVWFEADLSEYREHRPGTLFFSMQPGRDYWLGSGTFITVRPWDEWVLIVMYDPQTEEMDLSEDAMLERVRKNIGDDSVNVRIKNISQWQINHVLAQTYRKDHVFLVGDAAHRHPPANGLGSNTSVQDSYNLAWKISAVVKGLATDTLLESYDAERRPVGRQVIDRAMASVQQLGQLPGALGIATPDDAAGQAALDDFFAATESGERRRDDVQRILDDADCQFNAHGVEMNQRYASTAVIPDGPVPPFAGDHEFHHQPLCHPGAVIPHVWLERDGQRISTIDLTGQGRFTLFTGVGGDPWATAAREVSHDLGVEVDVRPVGPGLEYADHTNDWRRVREVGDAGAVLVRPDRVIAWHCQERGGDHTDALRTALRTVLGHQLNHRTGVDAPPASSSTTPPAVITEGA